MKKFTMILLISMLFLVSCSKTQENKETVKEESKTEIKEDKKIMVGAAASLTDAMKEIGEAYQKKEHVKIEFNFASSGAIQKQIEEGAKMDLFFSASNKQMKELIEKGYIDEKDKTELLENELVLIGSKDKKIESLNTFEDLIKDEVKNIALGDPSHVPVGQYSEEALKNLNIYDEVKKKTSFGQDVRQVLSWVEEKACQAGLVYKTDAILSKDKVEIIASAPEGSHKKVIYPIASIKESKNKEETKAFVEHLKSDEAIKVFEKYGFVKAK